MQSKKLFITVVLNIFLVLIVSVIGEYNALSERFMTLENTVNTSLDMAIANATASEELFTSEYDAHVGSTGAGANGLDTHNGILVYDNGNWVQGNSYVMAMYYNTYGYFPSSAYSYQRFYNAYGSRDKIYEYLFGQVGTSVNDYRLSWGFYSPEWENHVPKNERRANSSSYNAFNDSMSPEHKQMNDMQGYYDAIGKYITTTGVVKVRESTRDDYNLEEMEFPVLAQMGISLDPLNSPTSPISRNNFISSKTYGKSSYYLTPYSLGVTYVPISIVKPMMVANIDNMARFNLLSSGGADMDTAGQSDGCVATEVYNWGNTPEEHRTSIEHHIVNDGQVEYDLSSIDVKVDYVMLDFYDPANKEVVANILGAKPGYDERSGHRTGQTQDQLLEETVEDLKDSDEYGLSMGLNGDRLVARVTTRIKVHIPYVNPIFQWLCFKDHQGKFGDNHYDIKLFNNDNGEVSVEDDGLWYQTTSYTAISR